MIHVVIFSFKSARVREPDSRSFEMARMKVPSIRNATSRRYSAMWTHVHMCVYRSFLPLSISPFPRHVMFIDRALIHPG